jgi:hypothetical protein
MLWLLLPCSWKTALALPVSSSSKSELYYVQLDLHFDGFVLQLIYVVAFVLLYPEIRT